MSSAAVSIRSSPALAPPNDHAVPPELPDAERYTTTAHIDELACKLNSHRESFRNEMTLLVLEHDSRRYAGAESVALWAGNRRFRVSAFTWFEHVRGWPAKSFEEAARHLY